MMVPARQQHLSDGVAAAALLLLGLFLAVIGAGLAGQWAASAARHREAGAEDILGAAAAACGGLLLAWWLLAFLLAACSAVLERIGRHAAASAAGHLSPAFMRRLAAAALSAQLISVTAAHAAAPGPLWQSTGTHASGQGTSEPAVPSPGTLHPGWKPGNQPAGPGLLAAVPGRPGSLSEQAPVGVTVLAGDNLWDIAALHLGPEATDADIAVEWPRWYLANRAVIGSDPDRLLPGQVLVPPTPT